MSAEQSICPVCGSPRGEAALSACACDACGFPAAHVRLFAGQKSRDAWEAQVREARGVRRREARRAFAPARRFALGAGSAALLSGGRRLCIAHGDGSVQTETDAAQYSACENNYAVAYADGTVRVFGLDNSFGQKNTGDWRGVRAVLAAPHCTYGVTESGAVLAAGSPAGPRIASWTGVARLACGPEHVAGLTKDGRVLVDGEAPAASEIARWEDVADVAAARGCTVGLHRDGTVSFAGAAGDARAACAAWTGVIAVAADNTFVYGLTEAGGVLVAGACKPFLDKGRSGAAAWRDVMALASNASGVAALHESGALSLAGTVSGDRAKLLAAWDESVRPGFSPES